MSCQLLPYSATPDAACLFAMRLILFQLLFHAYAISFQPPLSLCHYY
jgi:hypothetical protein